MLAIHSFFKNTEDIRSDVQLTARQANLSFQFLKKHNFTTILYTDNASVKYFKHIPYDNIIILDILNIKPNILKDYWSISKLISCSMTNEPYFHIDMDLFLIENRIKDFTGSEFFLLHAEPWYKYNSLISKIKNLFDYISYDSLSYNNAIFGGSNYLDINKNILNLIDIVIQYHADIENILEKKTLESAKTVFVEQYLFNNLIKKELGIQDIPLIIEESKKTKGVSEINKLLEKYGIIHLWYRKSFIEKTIGINNLLDDLEKQYF